MPLNLQNPKTRKQVLVAGGGLGVLVAVLYARHKATAAPATSTAAVNPLVDPTTGMPYTSGVPSGLGGGVSGTSSTDVAAAVQTGLQSIDWGTILQPVSDAAAAISDSAAAIVASQPDPAAAASIYQYPVYTPAAAAAPVPVPVTAPSASAPVPAAPVSGVARSTPAPAPLFNVPAGTTTYAPATIATQGHAIKGPSIMAFK